METTTLNVKGMTCMGCVRSVKNVLEPMSGVNDVDVSLETGTVKVQYDPSAVKIEDVKRAIEDAGYDVTH